MFLLLHGSCRSILEARALGIGVEGMYQPEGQRKDSLYRAILGEGETWADYCIIFNNFDDRNEGLILTTDILEVRNKITIPGLTSLNK